MRNNYLTLLAIIIINLLIMFALTFVLVFSIGDIFINLNRFYMAFIMVLSMPILMLVFMKEMFPNKTVNAVIITTTIILFLFTFWFIRSQILIGDKQFLRSMIPHHSGAITMCERSKITDSEIADLCDEIVETQQEEIDQMKDIYRRMN